MNQVPRRNGKRTTMNSPERIIERWIESSVTYRIEPGTQQLTASMADDAGARIIRALAHAGYVLVPQRGPQGQETRSE